MTVLVMGVAGSGKTTIGGALAREFGWRFVDADDYHSPANVAKMAGAIPLTDADRWPWLDRLNGLVREHEDRGESVVVACSALKESHRTRLRRALRDVVVVHLHGPVELISARLSDRQGHFMPASLLSSQLEDLEPPVDAIPVDVTQSRSACVAAIRRALKA